MMIRYLVAAFLVLSLVTIGRLYGVLSVGEQIVLPIVFGILAFASARRATSATAAPLRAPKA